MLRRNLNTMNLGNRDDTALLECVVSKSARHLEDLIDSTIP